MPKREQARPGLQLASKELDQFKRLVELQGQLVELSRQNEHAEKECDAMWLELARASRLAQAAGARLPWILTRLRRLALAEYTTQLNGLVSAAQFVSRPTAK